jgi:hypothetical protein
MYRKCAVVKWKVSPLAAATIDSGPGYSTSVDEPLEVHLVDEVVAERSVQSVGPQLADTWKKIHETE